MKPACSTPFGDPDDHRRSGFRARAVIDRARRRESVVDHRPVAARQLDGGFARFSCGISRRRGARGDALSRAAGADRRAQCAARAARGRRRASSSTCCCRAPARWARSASCSRRPRWSSRRRSCVPADRGALAPGGRRCVARVSRAAALARRGAVHVGARAAVRPALLAGDDRARGASGARSPRSAR